jgi:hypothetical protein
MNCGFRVSDIKRKKEPTEQDYKNHHIKIFGEITSAKKD